MMKNSTATFFLGMAAMAILITFTSMTASKKKSEGMDLGTFSMSLAVKDIAASKAFYEKLGFQALEGAGSVEQKWLIMMQGTTKIGMFQGMFPSNTLTFNPSEARPIHKSLTRAGVEMLYATGLDQDAGPCSFSFVDPDGNPILVDQH